MIDRRETILARLEYLLGNINSAWKVYRNKEDLTENMLPSFVLFDAHESRDPIGENVNVRTNLLARVKMTPHIGIYVSDAAENVGTDLNTMRAAALNAIFTDAANTTPLPANSTAPQPLGLTLTTSGAAFYDGLGAALDRGAEMTGEMLLSISFFYPLLPGDFA